MPVVTDDDVDVPQLAHLERCPKCTVGWLTVPTMATGFNTPRNKNRWYQMPLKCKFFKWRDIGPNPIKPGRPPPGTPSKRCNGYVCRHGRGSRVINAECLFGLCQTCCVHLHVTITGTPSCHCTKHENAFDEGRTRFYLPDAAVLPTITYPPYWHPPSPSSTPASTQPDPDAAEDAPSPPRPRRGRGGNTRGGRGGARGGASTGTAGGPGGAVATTAGHPNPTPSAACPGSNHRSTYAISFSPVYDYTLYQAQMIEQQRLDQAAMSKQVGHSQIRMTDIFWWDENGNPPREIRVQIPNDPWFHPRDSSHLVNRFGLKDGSLFQFYDWRKDSWLDGVPLTPSSARGSATPSSRFSTPSSVGEWSTPSQATGFDYGTPSFLDDQWRGLAIGDSAPATSSSSSAVTPSPSAVTPSHSAVTPSRTPSSSSLTLPDGGLDLEPAPRGPSASGWPWMYACDMIAGFKAIDALRRTGLKIPAAFTHAFRGHEYHSSTFNDNQAVYNAARAVPGELERWRELGRQPSGKWSEFPTLRARLLPHLYLSTCQTFHCSHVCWLSSHYASRAKPAYLSPSTLVKASTSGQLRKKAAALNFEGKHKLREKLLAGGQFTVGWSRVAHWIKSPPDPADAPLRGLALREWNMDQVVLDLVKTGKLSLTHTRSPVSAMHRMSYGDSVKRIPALLLCGHTFNMKGPGNRPEPSSQDTSSPQISSPSPPERLRPSVDALPYVELAEDVPDSIPAASVLQPTEPLQADVEPEVSPARTPSEAPDPRSSLPTTPPGSASLRLPDDVVDDEVDIREAGTSAIPEVGTHGLDMSDFDFDIRAVGEAAFNASLASLAAPPDKAAHVSLLSQPGRALAVSKPQHRRSPSTASGRYQGSPVRELVEFMANAPPLSIHESHSAEDEVLGKQGSYYSDDNDSNGACDDPDEPMPHLIADTLELYHFEDARYEPSERDSSPPSTRPSSRASSEAETDYSAEFDLYIRSKDGLKRYGHLLKAARREKAERQRPTLFDDSVTGEWPETLIWRGCGDVAALGEDRTVAGHCSDIIDVLPKVRLYFDRREGVFTVSSELLVDRLIKSITVTNVFGYLGVPIKVGGMVRIRRLAFWDQARARVTSLHPDFKVELFILDPKLSSHDLRRVRLGVKVSPVWAPLSVGVHVCWATPPTHTARASACRVESEASESESHQDGVPPASPSEIADYTPDERFQALQEWLFARFGGRPEYRSLRMATRQTSQHASTLLPWVKFAKEVKNSGPVDDEEYPAAQGLSVTNAALGVFLDRGHDWIKDALDAQDAIDSRHPDVGALTAKLMTKGVMLGAKTLAQLCIAARDGKDLPALP
ncbi:hypothetical protein C8T65DRAFT_703818 [Cerioporus squamosus]|nr:hypothetical protein C8T65DRAFT_703818 [Cerioporus squamosus]